MGLDLTDVYPQAYYRDCRSSLVVIFSSRSEIPWLCAAAASRALGYQHRECSPIAKPSLICRQYDLPSPRP
ncbi:hypothetical protein TGME49_269438 [Toxoplasma gondii ME49]|uniref:Uncharacterized protein n=11 Tax=Toxoplasma gondii TaxID=5811 RepID=A0A125YTT5_TOXGV|nr:hypothetical protein TGME49_269438 [Toxoplasma gondii ME49]EPR64930.1 hypothetical protein TGGT1_269438 [Toxoplasma gondii GT1]ESS36402.1 hypothetical protein TGVEG_269438 [Toxoplasma gondii VEG]KFG43916.1 hypothetical protein TGDOM2_269438 [Toxoplasma gondii GAB2-2007-GAL-DOM2]KFG52375.1 hypothetical protein TGP89_269438 [Toxoplasma gondii p89]KFG54483.1 hypothetical protein TGFOU_269438 [Toxoplasma gondii FOU]KFH06095.1 hypothetical protein TGVAND_269438 [Toxoplasma gondii VAND]KFH16761|eukprot:XP_018636585.1 hypothetical protein TGME49_269438 [Toxoplasma gondii ME49]